jgi:nucleoside-diphosphate-sugar epimerase
LLFFGEAGGQHPPTRKGAIRVQMERRLREASERGVRTLIVRAGDFFGPHARNNWFSQGLVKPGQPLEAINDPGQRGVGHQWPTCPTWRRPSFAWSNAKARWRRSIPST